MAEIRITNTHAPKATQATVLLGGRRWTITPGTNRTGTDLEGLDFFFGDSLLGMRQVARADRLAVGESFLSAPSPLDDARFTVKRVA